MAEPPRRKRAGRPPAKPAGPAGRAAARARGPSSEPASRSATPASRLIVQFNRPADPSTEQSGVIHDLVKKFARSARVAGEMPGAFRIDVRREAETDFRRAVQALPEWDVVSEGTAEMPPPPVHEDLEHDDEKEK